MQRGSKSGRNRTDEWGYRIHDGASEFRFELKGNLVSQDATELEQCRLTAASTIAGKPLVVDLTALSQVDEAGRLLLAQWHQAGAQFIAQSYSARKIAESVTGQPVVSAKKRSCAGGLLSMQSVLRIAVALIALLLLAALWADSGRSVIASQGRWQDHEAPAKAR